MSLLMDALKKAEQAKQQADAQPDAVTHSVDQSSDQPTDQSLPQSSRHKAGSGQGEVLESKAVVVESRPATAVNKPVESAIETSATEKNHSDSLALSLEPLPRELPAEPIPGPVAPLVLEENRPLSLENSSPGPDEAQEDSNSVTQDISQEKTDGRIHDESHHSSFAEITAKPEVLPTSPEQAKRVISAAKKTLPMRRVVFGALTVGVILTVVGFYFYQQTSMIKTRPVIGVNSGYQETPRGVDDMGEAEVPIAGVKNATITPVDVHDEPQAQPLNKNSSEVARSQDTASKQVATAVKPVAGTQPASVESKRLAGAKPQSTADAEKPRSKTTVQPKPAAANTQASMQIVRVLQEDPLYTQLKQAYQYYQQNEFTKAQLAYNQVLSRDGDNRDARLGLAAIGLRQGRHAVAQRHYQHLLKLNPKDSVAMAGMVTTLNNAEALNSESQIKLLLDQQPRAAYLYFLLGTLYASQKRWADAQQAYFDAYRFDDQNADYAFNLAVSLDRLGARANALQYYRKALQLSKNRQAGFNTGALLRRIAALGDAVDGSMGGSSAKRAEVRP